MSRHDTTDEKLPPHDELAERALLGCCLDVDVMAAMTALGKCQDRFGGDDVFYNLSHGVIFRSMTFLRERDGKFDLITLQQELQARGLLEQCGGIEYLSQCEDAMVSSVMVDEYIALVWEKFLARKLINSTIETANRIYTSGELTESGIATIQARHEEWMALLSRGSVTPKNLKAPADFGEEYYNQWFDRQEDTYGFALPFGNENFPLRWRDGETTLMTGDNGSGKSSMLAMLCVFTGRQLKDGDKVVVASMEMRPEVTLWIMARQLLGEGNLQRTEENIRKIAAALAWLNKRVLIYNFLGITDKRELLMTFEYAAEHQGGKFFVIDNMMKVGIADDDYAAQGQFIQAVCDFDMKHKVHTIVVVHENKGDGSTKQKVRGSKQLTDAPDNVVGMKRNEDKAEKMVELKAEKRAGTLSKEAYEEQVRMKAGIWDSKFVLNKQRRPGSRQNASVWLYFHADSLQFHEEPNKQAFNFLVE